MKDGKNVGREATVGVTVKVKEATGPGFARYGSVFKIPKSVPTAEAAEFKYWSNVASYSIKGDTEIGWCTVYRQKQLKVSLVERHLRTPEILIPVDAPFILPVLKEGDPDGNLQAFRVHPGEAIIIGDGVWHGACLPVGKKESSYFVIFRKGTPREDVVKKSIPTVVLEEEQA